MKHIKLYEEQDPDKSGKMLGVIVRVFGYGRDIHMDDYYACVAPTFWDIATAILEDYMDPDDVEEEVSKMTSLYDLAEAISNWVDQADELDITIWTGLIPRSQNENYTSVGSSNPYDTVDDIDSMFTNAKSVMQANRGGASNDDLIKMIGDSIANDPSKFALYAEDDDLDKIIKSIGWPEDKVKSLLRYSNIRNQI